MYVHSFFSALIQVSCHLETEQQKVCIFFLRFSGFFKKTKQNGNKLINNSCLSQSNEKSNLNPQMHTCKQIIQFHTTHKLHNFLLAVQIAHFTLRAFIIHAIRYVITILNISTPPTQTPFNHPPTTQYAHVHARRHTDSEGRF